MTKDKKSSNQSQKQTQNIRVSEKQKQISNQRPDGLSKQMSCSHRCDEEEKTERISIV